MSGYESTYKAHDAVFAFALCVFGIAAFGSDGADAESGTCGDHVTWEIDSYVLTISGNGAMYDYAGPSEVPFGDDGGTLRHKVMSIVVEKGVTHIGDYAFTRCSQAKTAELPDTLTSIGSHAFEQPPVIHLSEQGDRDKGPHVQQLSVAFRDRSRKCKDD